MRSDSEKKAFAKKCAEIEKEGGDVLGYIQTEWPSYTPRATWYNLQRDYLKRAPSQYTEGRPEQKKGGDEMPRNRQENVVNMLAEAVQKGENVAEVLRKLGYTNLHSAMRNAKTWARENDPENYEIIRDIGIYDPRKAPREKREGDPIVRTYRPPEAPRKPQERSDPIDGSETKETSSASPTCCQPARPSGVTVPEDPPEKKTGKIYPIGKEAIHFQVKQLTSRLGTWEYNEDRKAFAFAPRQVDDDPQGLMIMSLEDWLNLAAEIPEAIKAMIT